MTLLKNIIEEKKEKTDFIFTLGKDKTTNKYTNTKVFSIKGRNLITGIIK
jgi:hypothetical protein